MNFLTGVGLTPSLEPTQQSPAEKQLRPLLFDDAIHVLSTFELNQVASLTYNALSCDGIFELMGGICGRPLDHTPLTVQKALVVTKHIVIYGSEQTVNHAYALMDHFKELLTFNTVLSAQKQGGALAFLQTLQGGGVDKGGPVRDAAADVVRLLSDVNELRRIRNASASQESLVPVGDDRVAFVTDEVRHEMLKNRIAKERQVQIKSNLAKAEGGWGAGYASSDGKAVVGAAHGIDEMIKMAQLQRNKFSDDNDGKPPGYKTEEELILEELKAEAEAAKAATRPSVTAEADLLGSFAPTPSYSSGSRAGMGIGSGGGGGGTGDLLDFGNEFTATGTVNPPSGATGDLLGESFGLTSAPGVSSHDPFGLVSTALTSTTTAPPADSLLNLVSGTRSNPVYSNVTGASVDPFAAVAPFPAGTPATAVYGNNNSVNNLAYGMAGMSLGMTPNTSEPAKVPVMGGAAVDRFAALDALSVHDEPAPKVTAQDAENAESRILGGFPPSGGATVPTTYPGLSGFTYPPPLPSADPSSGTHPPSLLSGAVPPTSTSTWLGMSSNDPTPATSYGSYGMPMGIPPIPISTAPVQDTVFVAPSGGHVAKSYGDPNSINHNDDDGDNPWVMGGTTGTGLEPLAPAPGVPPPPPPSPPSSSYSYY